LAEDSEIGSQPDWLGDVSLSGANDLKRQRLLDGEPLKFSGRSDHGAESEEFLLLRTIPASWIEELVDKKTHQVTVPIYLSNAVITGDLHFAEAIFESDVKFANCVFRGIVDCNSTIFERPTNWSRSQFERDVIFSGAAFKGVARFEQSQFKGPANFDSITTEKILSFGMTGAIDYTGGGAEFEQEVTFHDGEFHGLFSVADCRFKSDVHFCRSRFDHLLYCKFTEFFEGAYFQRIVCNGQISLANADFKQKASFQDTHCLDLECKGLKFESCQDFDVRGLTYARINVDWKRYLKQMNPYDRQAFVQLESFYRTSGNAEVADQIYYEWRRVEGNSVRYVNFLRLAWDRLYRWTAGYGVRIWPLVYIAVALFILGGIIFGQDGALESTVKTTLVQNTLEREPYHNLIQSFSVSLRMITGQDIPSSQSWIPSENHLISGGSGWLSLRYSTFAAIGTVIARMLVPFAVAAAAERLKRR
jgi:hypothetical protein